MNRSSKFNFFLPQNTDPIDVSDFNSNFETIDANLLTKAQNLTETQKNAVRANVDLNVANNLTTTAAGSVLDARQGKILNDAMARYKTTSTSEEDFNNCKSPGFYRGGSLTLNTPVTGYYSLIVMPFSSGDLAQIAIEVNNRKMYFRTLHDTSTWTTWEEIATKSQLVTETVEVTNSEQIPANTVKQVLISIAKTGYTPVGIMSVSGSGTTGLVLQEFYIYNNNAVIYFRNATSSAMSPTRFRATILYSKN